jgi:hypothetical protein
MDSTTPIPAQVEPQPTKEHRKQVLWQIWLPLFFGIAMFLCLAVASVRAGPVTTAKLANLSSIYLIIPNMVIGIIILTLISAMIYGIVRLLSVFLIYSRLVQDYFFKAAVFIRLWSDKAVAPLFSIKGGLAGIRAFLSHFGI